MSSGERPIGAAEGKQSDTEALCQTPPPLPPEGGLMGPPAGIPCVMTEGPPPPSPAELPQAFWQTLLHPVFFCESQKEMYRR